MDPTGHEIVPVYPAGQLQYGYPGVGNGAHPHAGGAFAGHQHLQQPPPQPQPQPQLLPSSHVPAQHPAGSISIKQADTVASVGQPAGLMTPRGPAGAHAQLLHSAAAAHAGGQHSHAVPPVGHAAPAAQPAFGSSASILPQHAQSSSSASMGAAGGTGYGYAGSSIAAPAASASSAAASSSIFDINAVAASLASHVAAEHIKFVPTGGKSAAYLPGDRAMYVRGCANVFPPHSSRRVQFVHSACCSLRNRDACRALPPSHARKFSHGPFPHPLMHPSFVLNVQPPCQPGVWLQPLGVRDQAHRGRILRAGPRKQVQCGRVGDRPRHSG